MFIEGLSAATLANGVVRVEALSRNAGGEDVSAGQLLIPATRLAAIITSLKEVQERIGNAVQNQVIEDVAGNA